MKTILVSLVSDHTIPNILTIHHFKPDDVLFVSTRDMEKKGKTLAILKTLERLGLEYETKPIIVQEDSILDCHRELEKWIQDKEDAEFVINLTGGTKIMSIAAYEFFKDYSSKMIYIPIPKNEFIVPFPKKRPGAPTGLDLRLSVIEYLTAYGLQATNEAKLKHYREDALERKELSEWVVENYDALKNLLKVLYSMLRDHRNNKKFELNVTFKGATQEEKQLLQGLNFTYDGVTISKNLQKTEIRYLTGGWLEEYCFAEVLEWIGKGIDNAVIGVQMKDGEGRNNEFDVMFTKDNALCFVECKSLDPSEDKSTEALYKIGALQKGFGLKVESFFVTTSLYILKDGEIRPSIQARADQFKTMVIPPSEVNNFSDRIAARLKLSKEAPVDRN